MPVQYETVAIPVTKGVDLRTGARLVQAPSLLQAINSRISSGSSKRYGHVERRVTNGLYEPGYQRPDEVLPGYGPLTASGVPSPEAGSLLGVTKRDNELLAWNGGSLFSYAQGTDSFTRIDRAAMPTLRSAQVAKANTPQSAPDSADTATARIVIWYDPSATQIKYSVYDTARNVAVVSESPLVTSATLLNARCWATGSWFHVAVVNTATLLLTVYNINQYSPTVVTTTSLGQCFRYYDFWKIDETTTVFLKNQNNDLCFLYYLNEIGALSGDYTSGVEVDLDVWAGREVAICAHPEEDRLGIAVVGSDLGTFDMLYAVTTLDGTPVLGTVASLGVLPADVNVNHIHLTIAPRFVKQGGLTVFDAYASFTSVANASGYAQVFSFNQVGAVAVNQIRRHVQLASTAFRAGNNTYVWLGYKSVLQSLWILADCRLNPVGKFSFGSANVLNFLGIAASAGYFHLSTVNAKNVGLQRDVNDFTVALGFRERLAVTSADTGLYAEPGITLAELNFKPKLRAAQVGRSTYFAGAQLWAYDGEELTEAGFHIAPEATASQVVGGSLTALGTYTYRVDLCYRNAQNEEVRSHSLILPPVVLVPSNRSISLTIKTALTTRADAYFLVFRTAMISGAPTSTWNLVNTRDPTDIINYKVNDQSLYTVTWLDNGSVTDALSIQREPHPGNSGAYLQPFSAPACEIIAAGKDRLWVAGGELPPGQIAPSRLFFPGETPAFNANINIQVDRNAEPITAIGFLGDVAAIFRRTQIYLQDGDGPDNEANGYWQPTRLGLADSGAVSQESLALIAPGLIYQSPAGFRLLNAAGGMINRTNERATTVGDPVDDQAVNFTSLGAVVVAEDQEVRWYGADKTFVYNYVDDIWSTWTTTAVGAVADTVSGRAVLARPDGTLWFEAKDVWRDGDRPYTHLVQFPWLHAGDLGDFQRVRRIMGIGLSDPAIPHKVRVDIRYDERDFPEEYWEWNVPDPESQNNDTWGAGTWGDGSWGDTTLPSMRDSVWRWRRRPHRQKCSVFSVTVSDLGTDGPGFTLTALGLELGKKMGLDRISPVTGGTTASR